MTDQMAANDAGAKEQAQQVAGEAQEKAREAAGEAKSRVREQVEQRSTEAGQRVRTTADDIRGVGDELRKQGRDQPAKLAAQVADRAERLGGYLERSDGDTILRDAEDFGRRQPWAIALGGLAIGLVASRMLKASSQSRYEQSKRRVSDEGLSGGTWSSERDLAQAERAPHTVGA